MKHVLSNVEEVKRKQTSLGIYLVESRSFPTIDVSFSSVCILCLGIVPSPSFFSLLPPANEVYEGYVCQPFYSQGVVCLSACWDTHPTSSPGANSPQSRHTLPGTDTPLEKTPPKSRHPSEQTHPPVQCMLGDTGNKRPVRILLECILVRILFLSLYLSSSLCIYLSVSLDSYHVKASPLRLSF